MKRNKLLKILIIILAVLLGISTTALVGTLLYNHFSQTESATVDVSGNIITPNGESSGDIHKDNPTTGTSSVFADAEFSKPSTSNTITANSSFSQTTNASSISGTDASALSLHIKQSEDNTPFQVKNMFPGDSETAYFRIKVSYKGDIVVRYHADIRSGYEKFAEVLKIKVRLYGSDDVLYDGLMRDMPKSLNHTLYTKTKTQSELYYEITAYLDTSVGNAYMDKNLMADFRWWVEETENLDSPQTGDTTNIYLWIALAAGSFLCIVILLAKRRKETGDEY